MNGFIILMGIYVVAAISIWYNVDMEKKYENVYFVVYEEE